MLIAEIVAAYFVAVGIMGIIALLPKYSDEWLHTESDAEVVFRKPLLPRIVVAMVAVLFSVGPLLFFFDGGPRFHDWWAFRWFLLTMGGPMGLCCWYLAGPQDTRLDLREGIYTFTSGWPLHARVWHGSLDDFAGVYTAWRGYTCFVMLRWKQSVRTPPGLPRPVLGAYSRRKSAETRMEMISSRVGLPVVADPWKRIVSDQAS